MRNTTTLEKLSTSCINMLFVFILCFPFWTWDMEVGQLKLISIFTFFIYSLSVIFVPKNRCLWMILLGTYWKKKYSRNQHFTYAVLYTLSFSSLLFWVFFPLDLLILNILILQIPSIILTGTTFHGYLSWNMITVKEEKYWILREKP